MPNDWANDKIQELMFDSGLVDHIEEICTTPYITRKYVHGWKNGQRVVIMVWLNNEGEWVFEYRETEK